MAPTALLVVALCLLVICPSTCDHQTEYTSVGLTTHPPMSQQWLPARRSLSSTLRKLLDSYGRMPSNSLKPPDTRLSHTVAATHAANSFALSLQATPSNSKARLHRLYASVRIVDASYARHHPVNMERGLRFSTIAG